LTSRDFAYWLQGFFEIGGVRAIDLEEAQTIQKHLSLVFTHEIDPSFPADQQEKLNQIHDGAVPTKPASAFKPRC